MRGPEWRENLNTVAKEYCDNTTLHGYKYLALPHRKIWERCFVLFQSLYRKISNKLY